MSFSGDISTVNPTSVFLSRSGEVSRPANLPNNAPVQTNNFYTNLLLDNHREPVWTNPYKLQFDNKNCHIYYPTSLDLVYGPEPVKYFYYPNGIEHLLFTSPDFSNDPQFVVSQLDKFSINCQFKNDSGTVSFPLVQGMGFVTGVYDLIIPEIKSGVGIKSVQGKLCQNNRLSKYEITLNNDVKYTMYLSQNIRIRASTERIVFEKAVPNLVIQIGFGTFDYYDQVAGCYISNVEFSATTTSYSFEYKTLGNNLTGAPLIFAPPHMVKNFSSTSQKTISDISVNLCVLGELKGCITPKLTINVQIPNVRFGFRNESLSQNVLSVISEQASRDVNGDILSETDSDSMYFGGKKFLKYAMLLYITHYILKDDDLSRPLLQKIKQAYSRFINNNQQNPLFYDSNFKGIVSSATEGNDFGNGHYNDHHFHYGYHIYAIAIIIRVDNNIGDGDFKNSVKNWVELLIMDVFNINKSNNNFPFVRNFDFYFGHSWAKGLYSSGDGKDEESSSEDYMCYYGLKLYGNVMGYKNLEDCANLVLGILNQSLNLYFYYQDDSIMPSRFVDNKVSGIYFENKVDHTTYFGNEERYIHGIHMIPLTPISSFYRTREFVESEWDILKNQLSNDNWMSTCMLNYSLIAANEAYDFFQNNWRDEYLDDGLSLTYCLFYCASNM